MKCVIITKITFLCNIHFETLPEAITVFLDGLDFELVIRTAVSLGGDCDTLTCIAGRIAKAFYEVPDGISAEGYKRLNADMREVPGRFYAKIAGILI